MFFIVSHYAALCESAPVSYFSRVVLAQPWVDILAYGGRGGRGVGVTLEVRLHRFVMGENGRREWGKFLGWVT